jgi:hypothetical protein
MSCNEYKRKKRTHFTTDGQSKNAKRIKAERKFGREEGKE